MRRLNFNKSSRPRSAISILKIFKHSSYHRTSTVAGTSCLTAFLLKLPNMLANHAKEPLSAAVRFGWFWNIPRRSRGDIKAKRNKEENEKYVFVVVSSLWSSFQIILLLLFKVYDATAKIPSGLLNGNINQFGDFDECVGIEGSDGIQGQYCLAYLQLAVDESRLDLKHLHRLVHSHYAFRSNITDVSTYVYVWLPSLRNRRSDVSSRWC